MRKYTINQFKGRLSNGKAIDIEKSVYDNNMEYIIWIVIRRLDILKELKLKYTSETYVVTIEKFESDNPTPEDEALLIDERLEFNSVEEILDYLEEKNYCKKEEIIKDEQI